MPLKRITLFIASVLMFTLAFAGVVNAGTTRQNVKVSWKNGKSAGKTRDTFVAPGIGKGEIMCRRNATWIKFYPYDRTAENQLWSVKYENKNGKYVPAVRNARVYQFSTPTSKIGHGTGRSTYEGFNQNNHGIEDFSTGEMTGIISERGARNRTGGYAPPATTFTLNWNWERFQSDPKSSFCKVTATFLTQTKEDSKSKKDTAKLPVTNSLDLNWHGQSDKDTGKTATTYIPGLGTASMVCQPGELSLRQIVIKVDNMAANPYGKGFEYEGEGEEAAIESAWYLDTLLGTITIDLPENGMLKTMFYHSNGDEKPLSTMIVSSIRKTNDPDAADNFCEVAAQVATYG